MREHPVVGPYVEGLSSYVIESLEDIKVRVLLDSRNSFFYWYGQLVGHQPLVVYLCVCVSESIDW